MNLNKILLILGFAIVGVAVYLSANRPIDLQEPALIDNNQVQIHYFWSASCPYCRNQNVFWENFLTKYPEVNLNRYSIDDRRNISLFEQMIEEYQVGRNAGAIPATFIGDEYFIGFDNEFGIGAEIERVVLSELAKLNSETTLEENEQPN